MNKHLDSEFNRVTKNTCGLRKKTLTGTVIGRLYVQKVAELLKKIEEVLGG